MLRTIQNISLFILLIVLNGCGYTFQGSGSVLPPDIKKVYIPFVENDSTEGGIASVLTEALRDQFERYGIVEIVENARESDAELTVRIKSVTKTSRSVTSKSDIALQFDTVMLISAVLKRQTGAVLWRNDNFSISTAFAASEGGLVSSSSDFAQGVIGASSLDNLDPRQFARSQEQAALEQIALLASRRIYEDSVAPDF